MPLRLYCPHCQESFWMPDESFAARVLDQMLLEGPWGAIGDGETPEDQISTALSSAEGVVCPECGHSVEFDQAGLGQFTQELLGQW